MLRKIIPLLLLIAGFTFLSESAQAQLNFFNGSPCAIRVQASASNSGNPCGPTCATAVVNIGPGGSAVLPVGICAFFANQYRAVRFQMVGGISGAADLCVGPNPFLFTDCQGNPRQLRIFSPTQAGIF